MKLRSFKYFVSEGIKSIKINWVMSIASVVTVAFSLMIFCFFMVVTMNVNYVMEQLQDEYQLLVIIDENTSSARTRQIETELSDIGGVAEVEFESKEQALEEMRKDFDDPAYFEGLEDDNPLRDKYKVSLVNLSERAAVEKVISGIDGVASVNSSVEIEEKLAKTTKTVNLVSIWIYVLLLIISVTIITNTIRLAVYARRKEINIMKFIGATNWFIRWPFIVEGIIIGLVASAITVAVALPVYDYVAGGIVDMFRNSGITLKPKAVYEVGLIITGACGALGIMSGVVGSLISVRKHLDV